MLSVYPPLPLTVWLRSSRRPLPFPLEEPHCRLYAQARHGLLAALRSRGVGPGDEILMPAYHHGSEVEAVRRAGMSCRFYDVGHTVEPDESKLRLLLGRRVRALYLIHYLGLPQNPERWRRFCDAHELFLVEDAAQSWLSASGGRPVGSHGDVAIYCLYKSYGLPDGAAVVARPPAADPTPPPLKGVRTTVLLHRRWLQQRLRLPTSASDGGDAPETPERDFAVGDRGLPPSRAAMAALPRVVATNAAARRRSNFAYLDARLGEHRVAAFPQLTNEASPLAYPVTTPDKPGLLQHLLEHGVDRRGRMWETPHPELPVDEFPGAAGLRATVVGLPVHQELTRRELERIAAAAEAGLRGANSGR